MKVKLIDIYLRSDYEMFTQGNASTLVKFLIPRFFISLDNRIGVRFLFWNVYIGYGK